MLSLCSICGSHWRPTSLPRYTRHSAPSHVTRLVCFRVLLHRLQKCTVPNNLYLVLASSSWVFSLPLIEHATSMKSPRSSPTCSLQPSTRLRGHISKAIWSQGNPTIPSYGQRSPLRPQRDAMSTSHTNEPCR
ncbi:hypothetical protein L226DRAFT_66869 [Lentinus tigrinus ALCF2SS1-7]|uniref:uncharacterized protein n=1 Tax=Lentinus tigrinus ALCF2SS1-7 TaxID=1328758 RepID=UPI0011662372|nr:hypothetical protein L226DRAFT_66869 [Lentinus tigrinus ALCF2SS1-7]